MIRPILLVALVASNVALAQNRSTQSRVEARIAEESATLLRQQREAGDALRAQHNLAERSLAELERVQAQLDDAYAAAIRRARSRFEAAQIQSRYDADSAAVAEQTAVQLQLLSDLEAEFANATVTHRIQVAAQSRRNAWLREKGVDAPSGVTASVRALFPVRPGSDAHERFFEITFAPVAGEQLQLERLDYSYDLTPRLFDVCDSDRYFLHLPVRDFKNGLSAGEIAAFQAELNEQTEAWWFASDAARHDVLPIRRAAAPHVVRAIRVSLKNELGQEVVEKSAFGRVCTFTDQSGCDPEDPPFPYDTRTGWHLQRIGAGGELPSGGRGRVNIALLDSGVDPNLVDASEHSAGVSSEAAAGANRVHGTYMAMLMRQVLPEAEVRLHSYRVFDESNTGTHHWVATALEQALFGDDIPSDEPLIVNLSLGWPPELGQRRQITVVSEGDGSNPIGSVTEAEAGVGEAVRHILNAAHFADLKGQRLSAIIAAAGNRPDQAETAATIRKGLGLPDSAAYYDPCLGKSSHSYQWFFPGEWGATPTCELDDSGDVTNRRFLTWAVSATDASDAPAYVSSADEGLEPLLVAPGEEVLIHTEDRASFDIKLPALVSGTSVSTALTSAVSAYAQSLCTSEAVGGCAAGLTRWQLGQLIYHSGRSVDRTSVRTSGSEMKVPDACRAAAALNCEADVLACIGERPDERGLIRGSNAPCHDNREVLMADLIGACADACAEVPPTSAPTMTDAFIAWGECSADEVLRAGDPESCDGLCSVDYVVVDGERQPVPGHASMGDVGPQPGFPECESCGALAYLDDYSMYGYLKVSTGYKAGTTFESASIQFVHTNAAKQVFPISDTLVKDWRPGDSVWVQSGSVSQNPYINWSKSKAVLKLRVVPPIDAPYDNISVISLTVKP